MVRPIHFIPGRISYRISYRLRVINTISKINNFVLKENLSACLCVHNRYNKNQIVTDTKISNNVRIAQIINSTKGGKTNFGNFYLGQPLNMNYLGRMEGMPGGSGSPPRNFN